MAFWPKGRREVRGKRRQHSTELKSKVAVEAIRGVSTVQEIASEYEVHPTLVAKWKREALTGLPTVFSNGTSPPTNPSP